MKALFAKLVTALQGRPVQAALVSAATALVTSFGLHLAGGTIAVIVTAVASVLGLWAHAGSKPAAG